jgi:hypothetical protein
VGHKPIAVRIRIYDGGQIKSFLFHYVLHDALQWTRNQAALIWNVGYGIGKAMV